METVRVDILNPKAKKLLQNLADLKLIKINIEEDKSDFMELLKKLRSNDNQPLSMSEITKEVESVRKNRYGK